MALTIGIRISKAVQFHAGPVGSPTAGSGAGTAVVSQSDVEDKVSCELDRLSKVEKDDNGTANNNYNDDDNVNDENNNDDNNSRTTTTTTTITTNTCRQQQKQTETI